MLRIALYWQKKKREEQEEENLQKKKSKESKKEKLTIWVYIRKLKRQILTEKFFKNIFLQFLPFGVAHVNSYSERCKTNRAEQHLTKQKGAD